jgi:hypothetical protein
MAKEQSFNATCRAHTQGSYAHLSLKKRSELSRAALRIGATRDLGTTSY